MCGLNEVFGNECLSVGNADNEYLLWDSTIQSIVLYCIESIEDDDLKEN